MELIALIVYQQHFALPNLVDLTANHLVNLVLVLLVERIVLKLQNLRSQSLTQVEDGTAAELLEVNLLRHFLTHLVVGLNLLGLTQFNLLVLIYHHTVRHNHTVTVNLKVSLVGVNDHVKILVRTKELGNNVAEAFFQHANQSGTIDVFGLLKFLEGLNH